jgi:hypothetical protein
MVEYWNSEVFQYRRTGVLARTCVQARTPARQHNQTVFHHSHLSAVAKVDIPTFQFRIDKQESE